MLKHKNLWAFFLNIHTQTIFHSKNDGSTRRLADSRVSAVEIQHFGEIFDVRKNVNV